VSDITERLSAALADRYTIERELGAGGMATVYLAQDLKHDRKVALKVLRPELAAVLGADRFVQEIKTTAALQHPHILPLFDSGTAGGLTDEAATAQPLNRSTAQFLFYVMPYIEGETLRDKLTRETQLSIDEAVKITTEVADALDYAHRHGVIHRDIKPENILLHDGRPMVADFGIALAVSAAAGGRMTETGMSLGTPHYMSPEQATAEKDLTNRSDVYSLGSVLYEMLTGEPPHLGNSAQAIIMKIVTEDAEPVTKLRKSVPPNVAAAVAKSLERLPADRFETAKAFADALVNPSFTSVTVATRTAAVLPSSRLAVFVAVAASIVALAAIAFGIWALQRRPAIPTVRLSVAFPAGQQIRPIATRRFALARDGSRLVYVGPDSAGGTQLWVRDLDALTGHPLAGTSGAQAPFFSPDGESVGYFTGPIGDLRVTSIRGGAPRTLVRDSAQAWGGSWCDDDIYFTAGSSDGARVSEQGGPVEILSHPDQSAGVTEHDWLQCLPAPGLILVQLWHSSFTNAELALIDVEDSVVTPIVTGLYGRYLPSGDLLYVTASGTLYRVPLNLGQRKATGKPVIVAEGVQLDVTSGSAQFDVSDHGLLAYMSGGGVGMHRVVWVDRSGHQTAVDSMWRGQFGTGDLSPDDSRIAMAEFGDGELQISIRNLRGGAMSRLSPAGEAADRPAWTPDGRWLAYQTARGTGLRVAMIRRADGSAPADTLAASSQSVEEIEFLPDGTRYLVRIGSNQGTRDIMIGSIGDSVWQPLVATAADEYAPAVSPDGKWFAYVSTESGRPEVFVRSLDDPAAGRTQISVDGGSEPRWAPSGREIYYRNRSGDMMAAEVMRGTGFAVGPAQKLFSAAGMANDAWHHAYSVSRDGRFLMINQTPVGGDLVFVFNWADELREHR